MKSSRRFMKILGNSVRIMEKLLILRFLGLLKIQSLLAWEKSLFSLVILMKLRNVRSRFRD
jgi:hypothetical protein